MGELFERQPKDLTREDRKKIILALRERRDAFVAEREMSKRQGRKIKPGIASAKNVKQIDIEGLDFGDIK